MLPPAYQNGESERFCWGILPTMLNEDIDNRVSG